MIRINMDFRDVEKGLNNILRYLEDPRVFTVLEQDINNLAEDTVNNMRQIIEDNRKQPARPGVSKLQNSIDWEEIKDEFIGGIKTVEIGIGNIPKISSEAPYWEMINDGGTYVTKKTHVVPTTFFSSPESDFITFKEGSTHTITGIDYVGISLRKLSQEVDKIIINYGGKFVEGLNKGV